MPRQARLDTPGTLHHVIIRGMEKGQIVGGQKDREMFVSRLGEIALATKTAIYAWSLMINHAHLLVRSGPHGLSQFMRRLLTGYAINYNRRHSRIGHVFHNRYKSIVCDEDSYFPVLIRYIHLNPVRVRHVKDVSELNRFPWSGHAVLMGNVKHAWQDRDYVLSWFGKKEKEAKSAYDTFVREGIAHEKRPELVGGGLVRSLGGWSEVVSLRSRKQHMLTDERILGAGDFVEKILKEADERFKTQRAVKTQRVKMHSLIKEVCMRDKINIWELRMGSLRRSVSRVRANLACQLIDDLGIPLAEIARELGVSTSAVAKIVQRRKIKNST
jgi:REP element-mobilizing transposase RayT